MTDPLVINNWQEAIADSPFQGMELVKNALVDAVSGAIMPNYAPIATYKTGNSTFTADASTEICTGTGNMTLNATGTAVQLTTTNTLPAGLSTGTTYFIIRTDFTAGTFKLATTLANALAGTAINITNAGTGVHTVTALAIGTVQSQGICRDKGGLVYFVDSNGRVWFISGGTAFLLPGNTLTDASGLGLVAFTNSDATATYLFVFRNQIIDVLDITSSTKRNDPVGQSAWTNGWYTTMLTAGGTSNSHHAIVGQDNIIYFCDDRYLGTIREKSGQVFDPSNGATYTVSTAALRLPQGEIAQWLEEQGTNIWTAGLTYNKIYPWNRLAASFFLPLNCAETGVYRMKNINNTVYILNGLKGNIYKSQGSTVELVRTMPESVLGNGTSNLVTWGGIAAKAGNLIFGAAAVNNTANSGVWLLTPDGRLMIDRQPITGAGNATALLENAGDFYFIGYAGGVDTTDTSRYSNFEVVARSAMYAVGTKTVPGGYSELEVQITKASASGSVRVSYRTNTSASFTTLTTFSTDSSSTSFKEDIGLTDLENIQIQVELSGASSNNNALQVREVRLIP